MATRTLKDHLKQTKDNQKAHRKTWVDSRNKAADKKETPKKD